MVEILFPSSLTYAWTWTSSPCFASTIFICKGMALQDVYVVLKNPIGTCHGDENNQINKISYTKMRTRVGLNPNPNRETRKTRTQHVQNKNQTRFYYKNKTSLWEENVPKIGVEEIKGNL